MNIDPVTLKRHETLYVRVSKEAKKFVQQYAAKLDISESLLVDIMLKEWIASHAAKTNKKSKPAK